MQGCQSVEEQQSNVKLKPKEETPAYRENQLFALNLGVN